MSHFKDYSGRTAIVTGAGDGIGEMLAKGFAEAGMAVGVLDIRAEAAERVAGEIGAGAFPLSADVSDRDSVFAAAEAVQARGGGLSLLWINAGVGVGSPVVDGKANAVEWGFGVNVVGAVWTAQAFAPLLRETGGARHVGVTASSAALRAPEGDFPLYAATKHGTFAVAEAMRGEFEKDGIGTTILCPGLLNTDIWDGARARPERFGGVRRMDPSISGYWREAKSPDVMWPHIEASVAGGGGYLVCATDPDTKAHFEARAKAISDSIVEV
ncbi:MAG: SDR family oxidoreductase [Pseudomonadota bacterium]